MEYYTLKIYGISRKLPLIALGPKIKVASLNLLGDRKLVEVVAKTLYKKLKSIEFDYLVGPEVKVVPLLHELSKLLNKERYIICRKGVHGYMVSPIKSSRKPELVLDGSDSELIRNKKVVIIDDVVSSGQTFLAVRELMEKSGAQVISQMAIFKQGDKVDSAIENLVFLGTLPIFPS